VPAATVLLSLGADPTIPDQQGTSAKDIVL